MSPRNTKTGNVLENMVLPSLKNGGYEYKIQQIVGVRPGGGKHKVDVIADKEGNKFLVSLKWQQVGGTAEQKVPFEIICLLEVVLADPNYKKAYLVLGGEGWTLRNYYISGELKKHLQYTGRIEITTLEKFVALANQGKL